MTQETALPFRERIYRITLDFAAIAEIEDELGGLPDFHQRLRQGTWTVGELVTACHILLSRAGCSCDYMALGDDLVRQGLGRARSVLLEVLDSLFPVKEGA